MARFPVDGYSRTTIRAIASDAGVSPALVVHHFGSKEALRRECDEHVIQMMGEAKRQAMETGSYRQSGAIATAYQLVEPQLRYLAWTLSTGGEAAARIFDDLVEEVIDQLEQAQELGLVNPIDDTRAQAAVLVVMQLGGLVLHEHYSRALGVDTLSAEGLMASAPHALRVLSGELFNPDVMAETARALDELNAARSDREKEET